MSTTIPAARYVQPLTRALAEARAEGIPAHAVARAAGVSKSLLSMIASGEKPATPETAARIAWALGRTADELFPEL